MLKGCPEIELIKEHISYNPDTGILTRLKCDARPDLIGKPAGYINSNGYIAVAIKGVSYKAHRIAWLLFHNEWPEEDIDHIDRDKSNNRISNLRKASRAMNSANVGVRRDNTSGYRGVSFNAEHGKWFAQIISNNKKIFLGYHKTAELASEAYQSAAKKLFGEFFPR